MRIVEDAFLRSFFFLTDVWIRVTKTKSFNFFQGDRTEESEGRETFSSLSSRLTTLSPSLFPPLLLARRVHLEIIIFLHLLLPREQSVERTDERTSKRMNRKENEQPFTRWNEIKLWSSSTVRQYLSSIS